MEQPNNEPLYTGRYLVVAKPGTGAATANSIKKATGLNIRSSTDFSNEEVSAEAIENNDGIFFDKIGIAVVSSSTAEQLQSIQEIAASTFSTEDDAEPDVVIEPEMICHAIEELNSHYLQGYKDAVNHLADKLSENKSDKENSEFGDEDASVEANGNTWGLIKTKTVAGFPYSQSRTGQGIKVAVLDTGMDLNHPDFAGRTIISKSFVPGQSVQDLHSHGTHCIGTACGPLNPTDASKPRYGVAYKATIYAGKVLANNGSGQDSWILAGINWAVANKCHVISMSLGARVTGPGYSAAYEAAAVAALNAGCLIIAAAGNDYSQPVSRPANSPSIMAVGAVTENLVKANFSNITFYPPYGKVDIAGPGTNTLSSVPMPAKYGTKSGTSMATPPVAGIAALYAQGTNIRGAALWAKLTSSALGLAQPANHVGAGLVQAPYKRIIFEVPDIIRFPVKKIPDVKPKLENEIKKTATKAKSKAGRSK